jgi:hypothetical protein
VRTHDPSDPWEFSTPEKPDDAPEVRPEHDANAEWASFHGPLPAMSEAHDVGLEEFATEHEGDVEETAGEADAHRPFDHQAIGIEDVEPDWHEAHDGPDPQIAPTWSIPRWLVAAARAVVVFILGLTVLYYTQDSNPLRHRATPVAPKPASTPQPAPAPSTHAAMAPPELAGRRAPRGGGQSAPSADSRPAAAPILSSAIPAQRSMANGSERSRKKAGPPQTALGIAPAPSLESRSALVVPPEPAPLPAPSAEAAPAPALPEPLNIRETELAQHRIAIHDLLDAYRESYDRLDALSAARLWPGVDTAALTRAFSTLSSQDVEFESCTLDLDGGLSSGAHYQQATALCNGSVTYVRRVGNAAPQSKVMAWTFDLDRSSGRWLIRRVVAK